MKKLLFLLLLLPFLGFTQSLTFTPLAGSYQRYGVGNDQWQEQSGTQSVSGYFNPTVYYRRFTVPELVNPDGSITFTRFDSKLNAAIQAHQKFAFRIFTMYAWPECPDCFNFTPQLTGVDYRTGNTVTAMSACPLEWFTAMQATAGPRPWISESGDWVPAYNSSAYLTRLAALHEAINTHLMSGSYTPSWSASPILYKDVIQYIDVSGFGTWGEWHSYASCFNNVVTTYPGYGLTASNDQPAGSTFPSIATMKAIIDAQVNAYDHFQPCIIMNAYDCMRLPNTKIPTEVGVYAYTKKTSEGRYIGRRIDHAGDDTGYDDYYLQLNTNTFGGFRMDTASNYRHRLAPFVGEPPGGPVFYNGILQGQFAIQARKWHWASIGNGNYGQGNTPTGASADTIRLGYSIMGYHLRPTGGNISLGTTFNISVNWQNFGLTPTYDHWTLEYSLRNGSGATVWTYNSTFDPYLYVTEYGNQNKTDNPTRPALTPGTYSLWLRMKDPTGYMPPMALQIQGRDVNGYYPMGNVVFSGTGNVLPTVNAGNNQSISGTSATLTAVASDADGTISSYAWTQVGTTPSVAGISAPTAATTNVTGLVPGTYTFNVTVTDNSGGTASDQVQVTKNNPVPPVANAGPNQTITLPTSSATLSGSGTDADGTIIRYGWTQVGGPTTATIASPATASTGVSALVQGVYAFRLTVTDNSDMASTDDVQVTVQPGNSAPVANAGANQTITLPTSSVNLSGSASTDDVGIVTYAWTKVGGPATFTITSPSTVNTSVTGLVAGVYIFRLTVTDAGSLTNTDDVQITVNAAPNGTPVANAGANQNITLPTSSVTVSSAGSTDDVGIVSRQWTKVSGPASFTIVTPTAISTNITGLVAGVYSFRITVTDGGGLTAFDDVAIVVNPAANAAPVSNAGGNQIITLPTSTTTLSGSASTDDVAIVTYAWSKISGPTGGFITSSNTVTTGITGLNTAGIYTYRLRVIDAGNLVDDDDVQITVNPAANSAPTAVAGNNITITLPTTSTTLNGSGSSDDVGIVSYAWTKVSGPANFTIVSPTFASTSVTGLVPGLYTFRLTVTDGAGLSDTDDISVTVNQTPLDGTKWWQFWRWFFRKR